MAGVKFYLEKRKNKQNELIVDNVPILLFYSFNGKRLQYFTGERTDAKNYTAEYWKGRKDPIKKTAPGAERLNRNLKSLRLHVENLHSDAKALGIVPTVEYFRSKLNELVKGAGKKEAEPMILVTDVIKVFLESVRASKAHNTFRNTQTAVNHFKNFAGKRKIQFTDIDRNFIDTFRKHLIAEGHLNNTVSKNLRVFRTFLNWCTQEGYYTGGDIKIDIKENPIDVIFLTYDEVQHLYNLEIQNPALARVRDVFVFGCFTGMRYSDMAKLRHTDVQANQIKFYITKGGHTVSQTVPLVTQSKEILDRYKGWPTEKALPVISNQKMNDALKEVAQLAGFDDLVTIAEKQGNGQIIETSYKKYELITCHTSRKSFITVSMMLGMPESVVKSITGHSKNSKAFARYYDIIDSHKHAEMNKVFK